VLCVSIEWRRLRDEESGRLLLGFGYALTIDAAQGLTSDEHIDALPRGTAGVTSFTSWLVLRNVLRQRVQVRNSNLSRRPAVTTRVGWPTLWVSGLPTPDSGRSLRQATYPQLLHHVPGHSPDLPIPVDHRGVRDSGDHPPSNLPKPEGAAKTGRLRFACAWWICARAVPSPTHFGPTTRNLQNSVRGNSGDRPPGQLCYLCGLNYQFSGRGCPLKSVNTRVSGGAEGFPGHPALLRLSVGYVQSGCSFSRC